MMDFVKNVEQNGVEKADHKMKGIKQETYIDVNGEKIPTLLIDWNSQKVLVDCNGYDCKWGPPGVHTQDWVPLDTFTAYYTGLQKQRNWKGTTFEGQPQVIEKKTPFITSEDSELLKEMYKFAYDTAKELTKDDKDLFKTVFNCTYWEGNHYLFQKKLMELKKRLK
jgi:hypothetical protein